WVAVVSCDPGKRFMGLNVLGNTEWFAFLSIPFAALAYLISRRQPSILSQIINKEKWNLAALAFSVFVICIITSKDGSCSVHLVPFVPLVLYEICLFAGQLCGQGQHQKSIFRPPSGVAA